MEIKESGKGDMFFRLGEWHCMAEDIVLVRLSLGRVSSQGVSAGDIYINILLNGKLHSSGELSPQWTIFKVSKVPGMKY